MNQFMLLFTILGASDLMCSVLLKYVVVHWRLTHTALHKHYSQIHFTYSSRFCIHTYSQGWKMALKNLGV